MEQRIFLKYKINPIEGSYGKVNKTNSYKKKNDAT